MRAGANGLGYISLLSDLGIRMPLRLWTDSTASQGMCARQGLGKVRHLDVQELWIQQRIRNGDFSLHKVAGEDNPGDLFTKASLTQQRIQCLLKHLGCELRSGRAASAPALKQGGSTKLFALQPQAVAPTPTQSGRSKLCVLEPEDSRPPGRGTLSRESLPELWVRGGMGAIRWSEEECRQYSGDEVMEILRLSGLPHQRRSLEPATGKVAEYPEARECPDPYGRRRFEDWTRSSRSRRAPSSSAAARRLGRGGA